MPTLAQLEHLELGEPQAADTALIARCRALATTDLADFTVEDLRIMLGQRIGVRSLLPLAVGHLERDPLAEGDLYPGDLLVGVLRLPPDVWDDRPDLRRTVRSLVDALRPDDPAVARAIAAFLSSSG